MRNVKCEIQNEGKDFFKKENLSSLRIYNLELKKPL